MIHKAILSFLSEHTYDTFIPKAVLFDMDGVLYDSMPFHAKAWQITANKYHLTSSEEEFFMLEGRTGKSTIDLLFQRTLGRIASDAEKKEVYAHKSALFNQINEGKVMKGAIEVLKHVCHYELNRLVVTGSGQKSLVDKLALNFPHCFERTRMVTADDVKHGKPHPEPYLIGLQKANAKANEAIVIENAPLGIEAAVAARIFTIAVNTGPLDNRVLQDAGANLLYPSMEALANDWSNIMDCISTLNKKN